MPIYANYRQLESYISMKINNLRLVDTQPAWRRETVILASNPSAINRLSLSGGSFL